MGYSTDFVTNSSFSGEVYAKVGNLDSYAYSGGIVGYGKGALYCQNYGAIHAEASASSDAYAGGMLGYTSGLVHMCYNQGAIRATYSRRSFAGGITGMNKGNIERCENVGDILSSTSFNDENDALYSLAAGITGSNFAKVDYCRNSGAIHATSTSSHAYAGGVVGYNNQNAILQNSMNTGYVKAGSTGGESRAGGIASTSYRDSTVRYCCNSGGVEIYDNPYYWGGYAGGILAVLQYGTLEQSCNHGDILIDSNAYEPYGSGITDFTESIVRNCYRDGNLHSSFARRESYNNGMICGIGTGCDTPVTNCYFAGKLTSDYYYTERYGLIHTNGRGGNTLTGGYTLSLHSSTETAGLMTDAASRLKETYKGYDFTNIWGISSGKNNGQPVLVFQQKDAGFTGGTFPGGMGG